MEFCSVSSSVCLSVSLSYLSHENAKTKPIKPMNNCRKERNRKYTKRRNKLSTEHNRNRTTTVDLTNTMPTSYTVSGQDRMINHENDMDKI